MKRETNLKPTKTCLYKSFDPKKTANESAREEIFWNKLIKETPIQQIYCTFESADNCVLRTLHMSDKSIFWKKKYNFKKRQHFIEKSYELTDHLNSNFTFKEVMCHTVPMITQAQASKPIELGYTCLGDPYESKNTPKDHLVLYLEQNKQRLLKSAITFDSDEKLVSNSLKLIEKTSSKRIISEKIIKDPSPNKNMSRALAEDYVDFNGKIESKFRDLKMIENNILREIEKVDQSIALGSKHDSTVSKLCFEWLRTKDTISGLYEERQALIEQEIDGEEYNNLEMSTDLKTVCTNSALIKLQNNAVSYYENLEVDQIQLKILNQLKL